MINTNIAEVREEPVAEYQKGQIIRLFDVFVIAPVTIYAGIKGDFHPLIKILLIAIGIGTVYYNAKNFLINYKRDTSGKLPLYGTKNII